ncbi:hypothetical protein [Microbulbifer magnicolonia]|uniref:hypothetical protein n=1 Tax=Microbulbifer magnicolonia TaxID=3109744 RepID=UPI002B400C14|nr:hypothetical protein [Microbulbifer sp. GG15]
MKRLAASVIAVLLCGCSGVQFNTNWGSYADSRVKAASVREYSMEEIDRYNATSLGLVEASHCQQKPGEREPSRHALVNDLKLRAQRLGGNGLVIEACGKGAAAACERYMECRAIAYAVPERKGSQ